MPQITQAMLVSLLENPSRQSYWPIWDAVTTADHYDPYADDIATLDQLLEEGMEREVLAEQETIVKLIASPRAHLLLAEVHRRLEDEDSANFERAFAAALGRGMLDTGDGSEQRPYLVTRTSDEYDVLLFLGKRMAGQALIQRDGQTLDRLECDDGTVVYFDITRMYGTLDRRAELGDDEGDDE